jgi:hypothetical protein
MTVCRISPPVSQYSPPAHNPLLHSPSKTTPPLLSQFPARQAIKFDGTVTRDFRGSFFILVCCFVST